jgi:membrane fusion protein (multidrug efflux system)
VFILDRLDREGRRLAPPLAICSNEGAAVGENLPLAAGAAAVSRPDEERNVMKRAIVFGIIALPFVLIVSTSAPLAQPDDSSLASPTTTGTVTLHNCSIKPVNTAILATDRPGVLKSVKPKEGELVQENELVAQLKDEVARANLNVAIKTAENHVEIEYAEKLNEVDQKEYEKAVAANQTNLNTFSEIEVSRLQVNQEKSRLQIEKAKHENAVYLLKVKEAEAELRTFRITAPFKGFVSKIHKYPGEAVKQGDPVLEIVNTDVVHVEGLVSARDIWKVKVGAPVTVHLDLTEPKLAVEKAVAKLDVEKKAFRGRIGFVNVISANGARETRVWAEVANPDNILRPGFWATMTIEAGAADRSREAASRSAP